MSQKRPCRHRTNSLDRFDDFCAGLEIGIRINKLLDFFFNGGKFLFQDPDHSLDGSMDEGLAVLQAVFRPGHLLGKMVVAVGQSGQLEAGGGGCCHRLELLTFGLGEDHLGINGIGLGADTFTAGEVTHTSRVDHCQGNAGLAKGFEHGPLVASRSLENHQRMASGLEVGCEFLQTGSFIGNREGVFLVLDLLGGFGEVDGDIIDGLDLCVICVHGFTRFCRGQLAKIDSLGSVNCLS